MPRSEKTKAAQAIVSQATTSITLDLVEELAQPLATNMVADYTADDWRDSPVVEALARVAALLDAGGREVPDDILDALHKASELGRLVEVA